ncbi:MULTISPECIES: hypothetical protein [Nocardiopsis]|uniref:DUF4350 domain-containing protein n=1 Tax=Nocardiopsis sinuspersici TaxID=501010 RepID=A0A1V3BZB1_9ACTN|nr:MULTISPECIES: hypothetical protein [Nocardiopsis]NYH54703.1 hypothetical protein [Nocardiopsis sinuspersici]OOC53470.1 hypothetical protein NOSIN_06345 [Nocardiopsis sinuspersici]
MFAEHRSARFRPAVAAALLAVALVPAAPSVGRADTVQEEMSATERVVAELEESPVHVDPSYASAFPEELAQEMGQRITESGVPLRVLAVPLIEGGDWNGQADLMAAAVHDRIGGEGHYLVLDGERLSGHDFSTGSATQVSRGFYASQAVSMEMGYDAPVAERVERAVEVALSDDPEGIYTAADEQRRTGVSDWYYSLGPGTYALFTVLPWVLAGLALLGLGVALFRWRRPRRAPSLPQHAAFDNANQARRDELADRAGRELVEVGERVGAAVPAADDPTAVEALHQALDAHAAARRVYDGLPEEGALADIAGVLVLLDAAEDHINRAVRPSGRRRSTPVRSHCYANPLHGTVTKMTRWREFGGRGDVTVPLCAPCAGAVRDRRRPTVLPARHRGREVPYYEVPAEESVWAATGYGTLRKDLVDRILRGDHEAGPR